MGILFHMFLNLLYLYDMLLNYIKFNITNIRILIKNLQLMCNIILNHKYKDHHMFICYQFYLYISSLYYFVWIKVCWYLLNILLCKYHMLSNLEYHTYIIIKFLINMIQIYNLYCINI